MSEMVIPATCVLRLRWDYEGGQKPMRSNVLSPNVAQSFIVDCVNASCDMLGHPCMQTVLEVYSAGNLVQEIVCLPETGVDIVLAALPPARQLCLPAN